MSFTNHFLNSGGTMANAVERSQRRNIDSYPEWDETDDYEEDDDDRCDFERDPSLANGWFFTK